MKVHRLLKDLVRIIDDNMGADALEVVVSYGTESNRISKVVLVPRDEHGNKSFVALEIR